MQDSGLKTQDSGLGEGLFGGFEGLFVGVWGAVAVGVVFGDLGVFAGGWFVAGGKGHLGEEVVDIGLL